MATVFMKWLETRPEDYERGIRLLTLGHLDHLRNLILAHVTEGTRVLEIGCGTGALTVAMAQEGAHVTAIDIAPPMLNATLRRVGAAGVADRVEVRHLDATLIGERFAPESFDLIVASLVLSELPPDQARYVLEQAARLLAPGGRILVVDEVMPRKGLRRLMYTLVRAPLVVLTWLLTRTTTHPLRDAEGVFAAAGLSARPLYTTLGGTLVLYEVVPAREEARAAPLPSWARRLRHRVTLRTLLVDLWALFFRIIPPYPKVNPGLYAVGHPDAESPVLVTGNFDLTVRRLVRALDGKVDVWLLVADSAGINVWCGAGGGYFTADKVIAAVKASRLAEVVRHRALILPQLCANGVDGWRIRRELGWGVHWGPVRAEDVPAYLSAGRKKTDAMRWVRFPLKDRLEMVTVTLGFYGLLLLLPVFLFWRHLFVPLAAALIPLSYVYAIVHVWLPGRDGLAKSVPLALIALAGMAVYSALWDPTTWHGVYNRALGMIALSVFTAAELQGMSPLMRGEQANWIWEGIIGIALGVLYWVGGMVSG